MSNQDHEKEMRQLLVDRFDKLDSKLDQVAEKIERHDVEIHWIKGSIKQSLAFILAAFTGLISFLFGGKQ